jgi:hypothetical protein
MECFGTAPARTAEWDSGSGAGFRLEKGRFKSMLAEIWQQPDVGDECHERTAREVECCFKKLADEWSKAIGNSSSLTAVARHPKYRKIIELGWNVLPFMLVDLQKNRRFWFPALHEITGIRPFDNRDAGNSERMVQAWVQWGKRKKLI